MRHHVPQDAGSDVSGSWGKPRLRDAGVVEARLCDWADELRFVGNDAAHDLSFSVTKEEARD